MYTVVWRGDAMDQLADVLVELSLEDQDRLADGIETLNRRLANDPFEVGESRSGNDRLAFVPLAYVLFRVRKADQLVQVTAVAQYGR